MRIVIRRVLLFLSAIFAMCAIGIAIAFFSNAVIAVEVLELIMSLLFLALCCWMAATRISPVAHDAWEKLYKRQFWLSMTFFVSVAMLLAGHVYWVVISSRSVDYYEAAEKLVEELVTLGHKEGIKKIYISIKGNALRPELVTEFEKRNPGVTIYSLDQLTPEQIGRRHPVEGTDIIKISDFSYPAWHVIKIGFSSSGCHDSRDYFYFDEHWLRMGGGIEPACI